MCLNLALHLFTVGFLFYLLILNQVKGRIYKRLGAQGFREVLFLDW